MDSPEDNFFGGRYLGFAGARLVFLSRESSNNTTNINVSGKYTLQGGPKALKKHFFANRENDVKLIELGHGLSAFR